MVARFGAKEVWVRIPHAQFFLSCDRREEVAVFSGVGRARCAEEADFSGELAGLFGRMQGQRKGIMWYFKVKEVEV